MPFRIEEQLAELQQKLQCNVQRIKAVQVRAAALVEQGYTLSSPEVVREASLCSEYSAAYMTIEKEYRRLVERMEADGEVITEQAVKEMDCLIAHIKEQIKERVEESTISQEMQARTDAQHKILLMEYLTLQAYYMQSRSGCLSLLAQLEESKLEDLADLDFMLSQKVQYRGFSWALIEEQERRDK